MPEIDDNEIEDLASSADPALDAQDKPAPAAEPVDAASSPATGETEDEGLLSVVRDVVSKSQPEEQSAPPAEGEEDGSDAEEDSEEKVDAEDDYSDVPFNKHPRFQELVREKNTLKVDAERYRNVQTFLDHNGLSAEEAADGLTIFALIKTNPVEAWQRAKPTIQKLLIAAGEVLPEDLTAMVNRGEMTREAALTVSRGRASVNAVSATRSFEQQRQARQSQAEAQNALRSAADTWAAERARKDPNFASKMEPLMDRVYALQRKEGIPNTPEGVREQLNRAYKAVVPPAAKPAAPAPRQPVTPIRGGQVAGNARPDEVSTLDIVRMHTRGG